jgi:hypothetical protein
MDDRVKYHYSATNVGALRNLNRVFDLSSGAYFMWACDNDIWERQYIRRCVEALEGDPSAVLCYSSTNLIDEEGNSQGVYRDNFRLDQEDRWQRYLTMISMISLCNCFFGVIRTEALKTTNLMFRDWHSVGSCDNILLCELVLKGPFIQLPEVLFHRRRVDRAEDPERRYARIEKLNCSYRDYLGISFPFLRMIQTHVDLVKHSDSEPKLKRYLMGQTYRIMGMRYRMQLDYEIERAVGLIEKGIFHKAWGEEARRPEQGEDSREVDRVFICDLLKAFEDALLLFPNHSRVQTARSILLSEMGRDRESEAAASSVSPACEGRGAADPGAMNACQPVINV